MTELEWFEVFDLIRCRFATQRVDRIFQEPKVAAEWAFALSTFELDDVLDAVRRCSESSPFVPGLSEILEAAKRVRDERMPCATVIPMRRLSVERTAICRDAAAIVFAKLCLEEIDESQYEAEYAELIKREASALREHRAEIVGALHRFRPKSAGLLSSLFGEGEK